MVGGRSLGLVLIFHVLPLLVRGGGPRYLGAL